MPPEIQSLYPKVKPKPKPRVIAPEIQRGLTPKEPPVPILQKYGFHGTIGDFTKKLNDAVTAHVNAFGYKPSPGLGFDLARYDQPVDYGQLFGMSPTQRGGISRAAVQAEKDAQTPHLLKQIQAGNLALPADQPNTSQLVDKYPTVPVGVLPIQHSGAVEDFFKLANELGGKGTLPVREQGQSLEDYAKMLRASGLTQVEHTIATKTGPVTVYTDQGKKILTLSSAITKLKDAQTELNTQMGTDLPITGTFNQTWLQAVANWMGSEDYFKKVVKKQASDAGFNNPQDFLNAWTNKQKAVHSSGWIQHLVGTLPLPLFHHGTDPLNILRSAAEYTTFDFKTLNPLGPVTTGDWSFYSPTKRLHQLTRSGGLALDVIGGTVVQTKADLAAGTAFANSLVGPGATPFAKGSSLDEAKAKMREALNANPNWLRVILPNHQSLSEKGWAQVANVVGDIILLRKPAYTGEKVAAGSLEAASKSEYLNYAGRWAFADLQNGNIGRAAARLEGGSGAEKLVARAAPLVKSGQMSAEQFQSHLADLYAHGKTLIDRGGSATKTAPKSPKPTKSPSFDRLTPAEQRADLQRRLPSGGYIDKQGKPRNAKGEELFGIGNEYPEAGIRGMKGEIKAKLAGGGYEYAGPLSKRDLQDLYPEDISGTSLPIRPRYYEVQGPVLSSLRGKTLPTPGLPGRQWLESKNGLRKAADQIDGELLQSPVLGKAGKFVSFLRSEFQHNVSGASRGIFDPKMPERLHDFVLKETGDAKLANTFEDRLVAARSKDNLVAVKKIEDDLLAEHNLRFPLNEPAAEAAAHTPILGTEGPSVFHFPVGGEREANNALQAIGGWTGKLNNFLTRVAQGHARLILGLPGGMSLFYKHMFSDTLRRAVAEEGFIGRYTAPMKTARSEIQALADSTPHYSRLLGGFLARSRESETRYLLGRGFKSDRTSFDTGKMFGKSNYMTAAGGYLRRTIDDDGLAAYQAASTGGGLTPLVNLVLHNKTYRGMWKSARKTQPLSAEEYSQIIFQRFRSVEDGLLAQGHTFDDALSVLRANRGADADKMLGRYIKDNSIDFPVKAGQVERLWGPDRLTGAWIEKLMTFNKWNRSQLATRMLHKTYAEMKAAGMEPGPALEVSADLAERMVTHHMLDFANRLQIEQDLRWVSYFATKHRLYWKWVLGTMVRHPGYAAAVLDASHALGNDGNIDFNLFGHKLAIPAARLMWIPGKEYSEVSPLLLAAKGFATGGFSGAVNAAQGNYGNLLSRNDTVVHYAAKIIKISTGTAPATYGYAIAGLDEKSKAFMNARINSFQNDYFNEHGHFASESEAVKHVLWLSMANEAWRSNLPLPVIPTYGANEGQKLLQKFMALNDPAKRRKFLDTNPQLSLYFGIYRDPNDYVHVRPLWQRYTQALDQRDAIRAQLYEQTKKDGFTPEIRLARKKADQQFGKVFDALLKEDLNWTPEARRKEVNGTAYGIWGQQVSTDPLVDPRKTLKMLFPNLDQGAGVPGERIKNIRIELGLLNKPSYVLNTYKDDPFQAKVRRGELLQQLDVFKSYPKDALGRLERTYQVEYVGKYYNEEKRRYMVLSNLPKNEKEVAYAKFRAWKDSQDKPVYLSVSDKPIFLVGNPAGLIQRGNIDVGQRPVAKNADRSVSTVRSITITEGKKFVLLPTVIDGKVVSNEKAVAYYKKTGENLGSFTSEKAADTYAVALHKEQANQRTVKFPSPLRMSWQSLDPVTKKERLAGAASGGWAHLADYEKELLGVKVHPGTSENWAGWTQLMAQYRHDAGVNRTRLPKGWGDHIAKFVEKNGGAGFYKDYLFAQKPTYVRLAQLTPIIQSPHHSDWVGLLSDAKAHRQDTTPYWRDYVNNWIKPQLAKPENKAFGREVSLYGPDFLYSLIR